MTLICCWNLSSISLQLHSSYGLLCVGLSCINKYITLFFHCLLILHNIILNLLSSINSYFQLNSCFNHIFNLYLTSNFTFSYYHFASNLYFSITWYVLNPNSFWNLKLSLEPLALKPIKKNIRLPHHIPWLITNLTCIRDQITFFLKKDFYPGNYEKLKTKLFQVYIRYIYFFKIQDNKFWKIHLSHRWNYKLTFFS
jgi:hypothetical protein